jgi:magnesium transporter
VSATEQRPRSCHVVHHEGTGEVHFSRESVQALLDQSEFFWLDLESPDEDDFAILRDVFKFHPLAIEDSERFQQRAKLDPYGDYVFLVVYGASPDADRLVEVHCFYSERYLVTVHRDEAPAFVDLRHRYENLERIEHPSRLLYRLVDGLVDSFFPILAELDDRIDDLEDRTFLSASETELQEIFSLKRLLVGMRKTITPQRDLFASLSTRITDLPGMTEEDERYFRDVYDHMIRISDLIDTYRDLLSSSMDVYLSTVSNRLNVVMKQLAAIATIFLPLTFLTGFFGQNFGWLVGRIGGWPEFVGIGIGTELVAVVLLVGLFKRRGWL